MLDLLEKLITEHGSTTILGKRLSLIKEQLQIAVQKITQLEKENGGLREEITYLHSRINKEIIPKEFIEHRGVLFRKSPDGKVLPTVFCPKCRQVMSSLAPPMSFRCQTDKISSDFKGHDLENVLKEIE